MNIYLPDDLQKQVNKLKDKVNWSEVAQQAFVQKLGEIAAQKPNKTMSDTIARLRASKLKNDNESQQAGRKAAQWWCTHRAEYAEIKRLASFRDSCGTDFDRVVNESFSHTLAKCAVGDDGDAGGFWDGFDVTEEQQRDEDFLLGFLDGVETFWEEVASEI